MFHHFCNDTGRVFDNIKGARVNVPSFRVQDCDVITNLGYLVNGSLHIRVPGYIPGGYKQSDGLVWV